MASIAGCPHQLTSARGLGASLFGYVIPLLTGTDVIVGALHLSLVAYASNGASA